MNTQAKTVLIVDDDPRLCLLIRDELSTYGFDCHATTDSEKARDLLQIKHYDVLISDITMPHVSGLELLALVRQNAQGCKVILITGESSHEYLAQALAIGAYDYVEKPFSMDTMIDSVNRATNDLIEIPSLPMRAAKAMQLNGQVARAAFESIQALVKAVEAKDPHTKQHSEHVARYAIDLAATMGATIEVKKIVRIAALLHDVGKIGVPDHILTKSGKLTDKEFEHIRRHPTMGADILSKIALFGEHAMAIRHHHERWDGNGYPDGLAAEEIPWIARIINIADSIDAMLMQRTYKNSYPINKMLGELQRCAGTQFDPEMAAIAVAWCGRNINKLLLPTTTIDMVA